MGESLLKKEFAERDVQRIRNIVRGNYGDKTYLGVGYTKKQEAHVEEDIWEEDGRQWTIKNGIKQNVTKLDRAKSLYVTPLLCPSCGKPMKKRFDPDYYRIHKKCFDCIIEFETELKRIGAWDEYEKHIHNSELEGFIIKFREWVKDELNESNDSFITESGDVERWVGGINKQKVLDSLEKTIEYLETIKIR